MEDPTQGSTILQLACDKELIQTGIEPTPLVQEACALTKELASQVLELVSGREGILPHVVADFLIPDKVIIYMETWRN